MITEDYVSAEVARLLKEKGFNQPLLTFYVCVDNNYSNEVGVMAFTDDTIENNSDLYVLAPTLQMAMKWLRETHNLFVDIYYDYDFKEGYKFSIHKLTKGTTLETHNENYSTYEQACDKAIKYCLEKLI